MSEIDKLIKKEIEFCEENDFRKNENQQFIYISKDGISMINLPFILSDYKDFLIENKIVKEL